MTGNPRNPNPLYDVPPLPPGTWLDPALTIPLSGSAMSDALLTPARRAGIAMFVLAAFLLAIAIILFAVGFTVPRMLGDPNFAQAAQQWRQIQAKTNMTPQQVVNCSFVVAAVAAALLVLAPFVLRGARIAIILAIILSGFLALCVVMNLIGSILIGQPGGAVLAAVMGAALYVLLMWLWRARGAAATLRQNWAQAQRRRWSMLEQEDGQPPGFMAYHAPPHPARQTSFSPTSNLRPK
jgi:hypothetical protein